MANSAVHTGFWIDHSKDSVLGSTITLEAQWGSQLVAAAAIITQITGIAVWAIVAFGIRHFRSKPGLRDEYDAQLQVLLRNIPAADSAAWAIWNLGRKWSGRRPHVQRSAIALGSIPALVWVLFLAAGVLVGQIATASYTRAVVLVKPASCGFIQPRLDLQGIKGYSNLNINISANAKQYARSCYSGAGSLSPISCSVYAVPSLEYEVALDQPCPILDEEACFPEGDHGAPIALKTKPLDSHEDFGINAPAKDRMTMQQQVTCAPLSYSFVDRFTETMQTESNDTTFGTPRSNATALRYMFGNYSGYGYTFSYAPILRQWGIGNLGYTVNAAISFAPHNNLTLDQGWSPVEPLSNTEGDLSLFAISPNSIAFSEPVYDPMFRTFETQDDLFAGPSSYVPTQSVYMLACSTMQNFCNAHNKKCTGLRPLSDLYNVNHWISTLGLNAQQNGTYNRMLAASLTSTMYTAVNGIPDPLLASTALISPSASQPLPNDQWRTEVKGWFETVLSKIQFGFTVFPRIPIDVITSSDTDFFPARDYSAALASQCRQQRVATPPQYQSYSFFGLVFVAFCGLLFPGIAIVLKKTYHALPGVSPGGHQYLSYQAEGLLQMHRMAMEGAGYGNWEDGTKATPRTLVAEERLPQVALDINSEDEKLTLRYPRTGSITVDSEEKPHSDDSIENNKTG